MTNSVIFQSIGLHLGGLFFLTFVFIIALNNGNKEKTITTKYFYYLIGITYIINLTQIGAFVCKYLEETYKMVSMGIAAMVFGRLFALACIMFGAIITGYFVNKFSVKEVNNKRLLIITMIIGLGLFALSCMFDIRFHTNSDRYVLNGPFSYGTYGAFAIAFTIITVNYFKNIKNLTRVQKLILPFFVVSYVMVVIFEKIVGYDISEMPYVISFYTMAIYFSIENNNIVKLQRLKEEQENAKEIEATNSNRFNTSTQNTLKSLNNMYIITDVMINKKISKEEELKNIDEIISNCDMAIEELSKLGGGN